MFLLDFAWKYTKNIKEEYLHKVIQTLVCNQGCLCHNLIYKLGLQDRSFWSIVHDDLKKLYYTCWTLDNLYLTGNVDLIKDSESKQESKYAILSSNFQVF